MVDVETGLKSTLNTKKTIYESFKPESTFMINLENTLNKDTLGFYDSKNKGITLKFY